MASLLVGLVAERAEFVDQVDQGENFAVGHRLVAAHPRVEQARSGLQPPGELVLPEMPHAYTQEPLRRVDHAPTFTISNNSVRGTNGHSRQPFRFGGTRSWRIVTGGTPFGLDQTNAASRVTDTRRGS